MRLCSCLLLSVLAMGCAGGKNTDDDGDGVTAATDCDDGDIDIFPGAAELCDGVDNDCDELVDDEDELDPSAAPVWFADDDGDGFGGAEVGAFCAPPAVLVRDDSDCDDADGNIKPGATEICDGVDNDCDGDMDADDEGYVGGDEQVWFQDADGDGFGSAASFITACAAPAGHVADSTDCDDSPTGADRNPGAPEICDGKDNNCDVATGLLVDDEDPAIDFTGEPVYYEDLDEDGFGDPATAHQQCETPLDQVTLGGDCDDSAEEVNPDATEVCDGYDTDCDGVSEQDTWALPSHPYRVPVIVRAPNRPGAGLPISVDVDFAAALAAVGDASGLAPNSVRAVLQDCAYGYPTVPTEVIDGLTGVLDAREIVAPTGDGEAAVVFLYDDDGNLATPDVLPANNEVRFDLYFGSVATSSAIGAQSYSSQLVVTQPGGRVRVSTGASVFELDPAQGGLSTTVGLVGRDSVAAQADAVNGNGMFLGATGGLGGWVSVAGDTSGDVEVVHSGRLVAVARGHGAASNAYGGFDATYTWVAFSGRPELYVKTRFTLDRSSDIGPQAPYWSSAVRPYQVDNITLINLVGGTAASDGTTYLWAHGSYDANSYGVFLGFRRQPAHLAPPVATPTGGAGGGRHLAMAGQDVDANPGGNLVTLPAGTHVLDDSIVMVHPHTGTQASATDAFFALSRGVTTTVGAVEEAP
jgi:hypothetical protein